MDCLAPLAMRAAFAAAFPVDAEATAQTHGACGQSDPANRVQMNVFN